jgi:sulfur relay (sulfurtransferase) complex TusBCD TusD component (DsrE family)
MIDYPLSCKHNSEYEYSIFIIEDVISHTSQGQASIDELYQPAAQRHAAQRL